MSREERLAKAWSEKLPCTTCHLKDLCKYAGVIRRVDYPEEVFNVTITCNIKDKYKAVNP